MEIKPVIRDQLDLTIDALMNANSGLNNLDSISYSKYYYWNIFTRKKIGEQKLMQESN